MVQATILPLVAFGRGDIGILVALFWCSASRKWNVDGSIIATFIALLAALVPYMRSLGWMLSTWQSGRAAADRVMELLGAEANYPEGESGQTLPEGMQADD